MKAVLDTNVLVSGLISPTGPCGRIVDLVISGHVEPCVDGRILEEYEGVIRRPSLRIPQPKGVEVLNFICLTSHRITPVPMLTPLPDPTDLPFLEVAVAAGVVLVTGNLRHFRKESCGDVSVASPAEFIQLFSRIGE